MTVNSGRNNSIFCYSVLTKFVITIYRKDLRLTLTSVQIQPPCMVSYGTQRPCGPGHSSRYLTQEDNFYRFRCKKEIPEQSGKVRSIYRKRQKYSVDYPNYTRFTYRGKPRNLRYRLSTVYFYNNNNTTTQVRDLPFNTLLNHDLDSNKSRFTSNRRMM